MGTKRKRPLKDDGAKQNPTQKRFPEEKSFPNGRTTHQIHPYSHPVISSYYPKVLSLRQYLLQQLPASSKSRYRRIASLGLGQNPDSPKEDRLWPVSSGDDGQLQNSQANLEIAELLDLTLVGVSRDSDPTDNQTRQIELAAFTQSQVHSSLACTDTGPTCAQSEIVDFVILTLFNRHRFSYQRPQHLLTHGYRRATAAFHGPGQELGALAGSIPGITVQYPNHNVLTLKQSPWVDILGLLGRNGEDIMMRLLFDCGIFTCINKQKRIFYQISGVPLSVLEPLGHDDCGSEAQRVRSAETAPKSNKDSKVRTQRKCGDNLLKPNSIVFVRRRMLYARPAMNARKEVRFGLRHSHVLNRFPSANSLPHTVHIMKYIFPRQFGLHNVFTSKVDTRETAQPLKDYTFREDEISRVEERKVSRHSRHFESGVEHGAKESVKIPKRLRGMTVELVKKLQIQNQRCPYKELLRHYCPQGLTGPWKLGPSNSQPDSSNMSSSSEQLATQINSSRQPSSVNAYVPPARFTAGHTREKSPPADSQPKTDLTDYATPSASVSAFCRAVLRKLIPQPFFGVGHDGVRNRDVLHKYVDKFIRMRRFESLSLHEVCNGLKVTCMPWLEPPKVQPQQNSSNTKRCRLSLHDVQKRTELLHEFIYYIFDSILIPLVRTNFYVTESQVHRNRLFYFRHDVWQQLTEGPLTQLQSSMFEELERDRVQKLLLRRPIGYGALRLLPKSTGIRPVLNLRRRMMQQSRTGKKDAYLGPSINSLVTPIYNVLNYEKEREPMRLGSAMQSVRDIHPRLKSFKERLQLQEGSGSEKPLYFVKLDIQSCFDTIPQHKLVKLIEQVVSEDTYHISKHVEVSPANELNTYRGVGRRKPIRKFVGRAAPADKPQHLPDFISSSAGNKINTVFTDTTVQKKHQADELLNLLEEHVRNNLVKIGRKYFRQRNGIPQGSVLSSLLCNFFYGELERKVLGFLQCDRAQLLRLVDDFLLITSDANLAMQFLQVMMDGQPEYGITVNAAKSLVNFEVSVNGIQIPRLTETHLFPYCGSLIDTRTLEVHRDQQRLLEGGDTAAATLSDALTVETTRSPGQSFHRKTLTTFKLHMHSMYLDTSHNSSTVVLSNLYASFVTAAMKMYRYMKSLRGRAHPTPQVVRRTVHDLMNLANILIENRRSRDTSSDNKPSGTSSSDANANTREAAHSPSRFCCSVPRQHVQYLAANAFSFVLGRKQTRYGEVLRWLVLVLKAARPRSDREAVRLGQVVKRGNWMFGQWRF